MMDSQPRPEFPVGARDAFAQAAWWNRYALDLIATDPSLADASVAKAITAHGKAAQTQHDAIVRTVELARR